MREKTHEIILEALSDYRKWFAGNDDEDKLVDIDQAIEDIEEILV